jgi:hypothetical protein
VVVTGPILFLAQGSFHVAVATGTGLKHDPQVNRYFTSTVCYITFTNIRPAVILQETEKYAWTPVAAFVLSPLTDRHLAQFTGRRSKVVQICWSQQFLEMQTNNVEGVRTFVGANSFYKCETTMR